MHSWWWCWFKIVSGGFIIKLSRYTDFLLPRSGWITTCSCMLSVFLFFRRNDQNTSKKIRLPRVRMSLLGRLRKTDAKRLKSDHVNQYIFKKLQDVSLGQYVEDFWRWISVSTWCISVSTWFFLGRALGARPQESRCLKGFSLYTQLYASSLRLHIYRWIWRSSPHRKG